MPVNIVGEPENLLLGLENFAMGDPGIQLPLDIRGVKPDPAAVALAMFLSVLIVNGPDFVSNGSGLNESCSDDGFCFTILSLAFSAASNTFSLLNFISLHGLMLTRKPCVLVEVEG